MKHLRRKAAGAVGGENNKCDDKLEGGTDGEGDLKNRQPNSQSKEKNPLGEIKAE